MKANMGTADRLIRSLIVAAIFRYASVEVAMRGQDAVPSALGHKRFFYPTRILSEGARNILRGGSYRHGPDVESVLATVRISRADVAAFMLNQLASDAYRRAAPGICS